MKAYIDRLERTRDLTDAEFRALLEESAPADRDYLFARARATLKPHPFSNIFLGIPKTRPNPSFPVRTRFFIVYCCA